MSPPTTTTTTTTTTSKMMTTTATTSGRFNDRSHQPTTSHTKNSEIDEFLSIHNSSDTSNDAPASRTSSASSTSSTSSTSMLAAASRALARSAEQREKDRRRQNRDCARRCRKKRKEELVGLEKSVARLNDRSQMLRKRLSQLNRQLLFLNQVKVDMQREMRGNIASAPSPTPTTTPTRANAVPPNQDRATRSPYVAAGPASSSPSSPSSDTFPSSQNDTHAFMLANTTLQSHHGPDAVHGPLGESPSTRGGDDDDDDEIAFHRTNSSAFELFSSSELN